MKMRTIRGVKLVANTEYDILKEFNAPIVMIQNQGATANLILNNGEPFIFPSSVVWESLVPLSGTIQTDGDSIVVFA